MKKLLTLTLVCLIMVSSTAFAEKTTETRPTPPSAVPTDYRSYTGLFKDGKVTLQVYHSRINDKDMFWHYVMYCQSSGNIGTCGVLYNWVEGKVAGQNWIIKDGNFNAVLGKKVGHLDFNSLHVKLEIE
jgi:hypothetical protein